MLVLDNREVGSVTFRELSATAYASGQINPADLERVKRMGVTTVVNNRPDGESPDQPDGRTIAEHARALGMEYTAIPVGHAGFTREQVAALARTLDASDGPVLMYCRSGTRSALLWALAQASAGEPVDDIAGAVERAGYSVAPVRAAMEALAASSGS